MRLDKGSNPEPGATGGEERPPSPIAFRLEPASGVPTYLQLVHQVEHALRLGYLAPGDQLPTVKDVVGSLSINPNTVLKAYRELEHKGLAAGHPGQGTFVTGAASGVALEDLTALRRSLTEWLSDATARGLDDTGITALIRSTLGDLRAHPGGIVGGLHHERSSRRRTGIVA
jgi:GntR family transcriptional regulator